MLRAIHLYTLDSYNDDGEDGKSGTSAMAIRLSAILAKLRAKMAKMASSIAPKKPPSRPKKKNAKIAKSCPNVRPINRALSFAKRANTRLGNVPINRAVSIKMAPLRAIASPTPMHSPKAALMAILVMLRNTKKNASINTTHSSATPIKKFASNPPAIVPSTHKTPSKSPIPKPPRAILPPKSCRFASTKARRSATVLLPVMAIPRSANSSPLSAPVAMAKKTPKRV